jgi:hypothetical protein
MFSRESEIRLCLLLILRGVVCIEKTFWTDIVLLSLLTSLLFHCRLPDAQCKREGSQPQTKETILLFVLVSFAVCLSRCIAKKILHEFMLVDS